jgi:ATP-dependent phosphoenolpyruvate carboxykinase
LNTGEVGERDIKIQDTVLILRAVSRGNVTWEYDPILGYEISKSIKGIDIREYDPRKYYTPKEFEEKMKELRMERIEWLNQFSGLDADILNAV